MDQEKLAQKAAELTAAALTVKTPEQAAAFAHDAVAAFRDAKEELAKVDAKSLLAMFLPFLPAKYRTMVGTLTTVLGLFGSGFGLSELIDQPDAINVTIPPETQAKLDAAATAATVSAATHKEQFEATIKQLDAAQAALREASQKRFVIRGYDTNNQVKTELDFFRQNSR